MDIKYNKIQWTKEDREYARLTAIIAWKYINKQKGTRLTHNYKLGYVRYQVIQDYIYRKNLINNTKGAINNE